MGLSTDAAWLTVGSSPVISPGGTLTLNTTPGLAPNEFLATPSGGVGSVGLRAIVLADLPPISFSYISGQASISQVGTSGLSGTAPISISAAGTISVGAATSVALGVIQLTGDLGDTAAFPEVVSTHLSSPLPLAQGGTGSDLNGTGGTSQVLRQSSPGSVITVSQLAASDLSNGTTGTGAVVLADGPVFVTTNPTFPSQTGTGSIVLSASPNLTGTLTVANLDVTGTLEDSVSSIGTSGQLLSSTGTATKWITAPGTGTVNSGTASQVAYYATSGTVISGNPRLEDSGTKLGYSGSGGIEIDETAVYSWSSSSLSPPAAATDTGLSRSGAGVISVGNGSQGDASGTVNAAQYDVAGSQISASNLSNGVTGTGAVVLRASPTLTGTVVAANLTLSGTSDASAGSVTQPSYSWTAQPQTGFYLESGIGSPPSDGIGVTVNGVLQATFADDGIIASALTLSGEFTDSSASHGTLGQVLISTGTGVEWVNLGVVGGANASQLRGNSITLSAPTDQEILRWSAADDAYDLVYADGLYHGDSVFEYDSSYTQWRDDFLGGTSSTSGAIGNTGWQLLGTTGITAEGQYVCGAPPHLGLFLIPENSTKNTWACIAPAQASGSAGTPMTAPLLDYPGWKLAWVWQWGMATLSDGITATFSNSVFYAGLANSPQGVGATTSRFPCFIGCRWDTDPGANGSTSAGQAGTRQIADTTIKLECCLALQANAAGRNTGQGNAILQSGHNVSSGNVTSLTQSFTAPNQTGNSIVVVCAVGAPGSATSVSDSFGNTYNLVSSEKDGTATAFETLIFLASNITATSAIALNAVKVTCGNAQLRDEHLRSAGGADFRPSNGGKRYRNHGINTRGHECEHR